MNSARPWTRIVATAAAGTATFAVLTATPAAASPRAATLNIVSAAVAADDTVDVTLAYTCDQAFHGTLIAYVNDTDAAAFGASDEFAATCDGTGHTAVLSVDNENDATTYATGDTAVVAAAIDATKAGSPDQNAAQDVTLALG
ncbi:hypothetical protein QRX60_43460 [Amycolatopsis mongoliensis]|uniref:Uncharacterized protein n=1 Tax=Amycolatopsis mongoliensis TaxID=715475 RepID=A0A9Y2NIK3_9PSEU|nr:hypothetical protein [Amycolatopsis sp. 4-36]WIY00843.1 hypothetical protein QRX60_43460 [Amycolatopsis sp. 4-36]